MVWYETWRIRKKSIKGGEAEITTTVEAKLPNPWNVEDTEYDKYFRSPSPEDTGSGSSILYQGSEMDKGVGNSGSSSSGSDTIVPSSSFKIPEIVVTAPSNSSSSEDTTNYIWNDPVN